MRISFFDSFYQPCTAAAWEISSLEFCLSFVKCSNLKCVQPDFALNNQERRDVHVAVAAVLSEPEGIFALEKEQKNGE